MAILKVQDLGAGFWQFLNSTFGLFLLSSVLLAGVSRLYTDHQAAVASHVDRARQLEDSLAELDFRVSFAGSSVERLMNPALPADSRARAQSILTGALAGSGETSSGTEYRTVHAVMLVQTIDRLSGAESDPAVEQAIFDIGSLGTDSGADDVAMARAALDMLDTYVLVRRATLNGLNEETVNAAAFDHARARRIYLAARVRFFRGVKPAATAATGPPAPPKTAAPGPAAAAVAQPAH